MGREKWARLAGLLAALLLYVYGAQSCRDARPGADLVHIVLNQGIDGETADSVFRREGELEQPVGFCFWGETGNAAVSCAETGASAQVTVVSLSGNPGLMGAECLAWRSGCLIDEATAQALFGTARCGGQTLWYGGRHYTVLGAVSSLRPTMLTVAAAEDGAVLNRCVLSAPAEDGDAPAQQFLLRWGLSGSVLKLYPVWVLAHNLLLLFPGAVLLTALRRLTRPLRGLSFRELRRGLTVKRLAALALTLGLLWAAAARLVIPQEMIPPKWSDFSFWPAWWKSQRETGWNLLLTPIGNGLLQTLLNMVKSMVCSTASSILGLWAIGRENHANTADRGR